MSLKFKYNNNTYTLPYITTSNNIGTYGSLAYRTSTSSTGRAPLAPYKDTSKTLMYSNGTYRYYYCSNYPSIHCRKNNTNYSCCNNYQNYKTSTWTFDYAYSGSTSKTVSYAENSYLGSSYNKYAYQTQLAPYGMVAPSRSGYTFKGWNTKADDTGTAYKSTSTMRSTDSNATFYALWAKIDAGTYAGKNFWDLLTSWFGREPEGNSYSSSKISNHAATLTITSTTAVSVKVGSTIRLYVYSHSDLFITTKTLYLEIDGTKYHIGWRNSIGDSGYETVVISNGWLTDKYSPHIAKGTYSPSSFKNLISQYISVGGSRTVAQSFTATVNGTSVTVPGGGTIYYMHPYTSNPTYIVGFTSYLEEINKAATDSFSSGKTYVVYRSPQSGYFDKYTNYSITLAQDIVFN